MKIVSKESDTADGSRRVFFNTPSPPYSKGDVWADYSFNGYMLVCQVSRPISASYNRLDWVVASKYTDDTKADEALDSANKANFFIPSAIEVSSLMTDEPYVYEGQTISYMTGNESRIKHNAEGRATKYWLRSPFATYDGYFYAIEETGELYGFHYPSEQLGVTVMFSI